MRLTQLVYLDAIIRHGSFHRAAAALHVSQPSLSEQIQELEGELGARLLDRSPSGTVATPMGLRVYEHVQEILASVDNITLETRQAFRVTVAMGAIPSVIQWGCLAALASAVAAAEPRIRLQLQQYGALRLAALLEQGELDVGCLTWTARLAKRFPTVAVRPLVRGKIVVAVAPHHPIASCRSATIADILSFPLVLFPPGYLIYEIVSDYLSTARGSPEVLYYSENGSTLLETIHQGEAVGFLYQLDTGATWAQPHDGLERRDIVDLEESVWLAVAHRGNLHGQRAGIVHRVVGSVERLIASQQGRPSV